MTQSIAKLFGVIFILIGAAGFFLAGDTHMLMDTFEVNALHNVVHILLGVWGVASSRTAASAGGYCRLAGLLYLILGGIGFIAPNPGGLVPLGGNVRFLHLGFGAILAVAGFSSRGTR